MAIPAEQARVIERLERLARYVWAAQAASGRAALDLGCRDGAGTSILSAAGASPVLGLDPARESVERARRDHGDAARFEVVDPGALPVPERSFDLITCFGPLERSPDSEAVLSGLRRALKPGGLLLASVAGSADAEREGPAELELLRQQFVSVALREQRYYWGTAIGLLREADAPTHRDSSLEGERLSTLAAASDEPLPELEPRGCFEPIASLGALLDSLSRWEERAREAEADVAVMRWETRIAGEKLVALVNRLTELENAPARRLRRRLRSQPARVSPAEIAGAAASTVGEVKPDQR